MSKIKCNCDFCSKELELPKWRYERSKLHFCCVECKNKGLKFTESQKTKICKNCAIKFQYSAANKSQVFCSQKCMGEFNKKTIKVKCCECGKIINSTNGKLKRVKNTFCSSSCKYKFQSKSIKGNKNYNYNPNLTNEDRVEHRGIDGYKEWRIIVFERDNYTCKCCGDSVGGNLNAHHILNYSSYEKLRLDINNGITLCNLCHKRFHNEYGLKNNNENQLNEFIKKAKRLNI